MLEITIFCHSFSLEICSLDRAVMLTTVGTGSLNLRYAKGSENLELF